MPDETADPARIRRIRRESEFARFVDPTVLAANPNARDGFEQVRESFFDYAADAQVLVNELATALSVVRGHEAAESDRPMGIGSDIAIVPTIPTARMVDRSVPLDRDMTIKGLAIDFHMSRNSIETIG